MGTSHHRDAVELAEKLTFEVGVAETTIRDVAIAMTTYVLFCLALISYAAISDQCGC